MATSPLFSPCLVIIKGLVHGLHRAASKENSEAGTMMSEDRKIYDSWLGCCLQFLQTCKAALLISQFRPVTAIPHPVTKIKEDAGKPATSKG